MAATVYCGEKFVTWLEFETALALFEMDANRIAKFYRPMALLLYDSDLFGELAATGAVRLVSAKSGLFR